MAGTTMTRNQIGEPISLITWAEQATSSYLVETKSQKFKTIEEVIQIKDAVGVREHESLCFVHAGV